MFPGGGQSPFTSTVSQQNQQDAVVTIYNGPVLPSSSSFTMTVTMTLANPPAGNGQNGKYQLVADRIQLILNSPNINGTVATTGVNGTASGAGPHVFGFLEYPLSATGALTNTSITALDNVGFSLLSGLGGGSTVTGNPVVSAVAHHASGTIFVGGSFKLSAGPASGASNIVAFKNGALSQLPDNGLNGAVSALLVDGDQLYVAGSFTDTPSGTTQGKLSGVAMYDVAQNQWVSLDGGIVGAAESIGLANNQLLVAGNFTGLHSATATSQGGFAAWNVSTNAWSSTGGFLIGSLSFISNGTISSDVGQFVSGNVAASRQFGASGFVLVQNGDSTGVPEVTPLSLQLKEAHWNVSGTLFYTLHELLQEHYEGVDKYKDMVAERLLAIGSSADGRATTIVKTSSLPEIPGGYIDDAQVIAWFTNAYKQVAEEVRAGIKDTEKPDPTTSNLLQTVEDGIDKYQWQMRAFVQGTQTDPNTGADINAGKAIDLPNQAPGVDPNAK